jgi:hypothetical protein
MCCIKFALKHQVWLTKDTASHHRRSVLGGVGGVSENGMLSLIFFSVVGMGVDSTVSDCGFSVSVQLYVIGAFSSHGVQECY